MLKVIKWGLIVWLVYFLFTQPTAAADVIKQTATWIGGGAESLATFISSLS